MKYRNIYIIGTSHISPDSVQAVKDFISHRKPDIVAVELDRSRLAALTSTTKHTLTLHDIKRVGIQGFLFALIGAWIEKKFGKKIGVRPGSEMLSALQLAQHIGSRVALIDQNIEITLKKISRAFGWTEKWHLLIDLIKGIFGYSPILTFDIKKVPSKTFIKKLLIEVNNRYPNLYRVLVTERNEYMAHQLVRIHTENPDKKILAVVGAGHETELVHLLKKYIYQKNVQNSNVPHQLD